MKAISLWQPWAQLVAIGAKRIETRHWPTNIRGAIAIHAAKKSTGELRALSLRQPFRDALYPGDSIGWAGPLPLGAIVAVADLYTCAPIVHPGGAAGARQSVLDPLALRPEEKAFGNYDLSEGPRYAWGLRNVQALPEPIPFKGAQGFFDVPDELIAGALR